MIPTQSINSSPMKVTAKILLVALVHISPTWANRVQVTPVQKVIELMEGMLAKGKKEKHDEQVQFAAHKQFCDDTTVEKKRLIEEANEKIEVLKADIEKYIADAAMLTKEIAGHDEDISAWTGDIKAATKVRGLEKADYDSLSVSCRDFLDSYLFLSMLV